jgi:hypothetical protein
MTAFPNRIWYRPTLYQNRFGPGGVIINWSIINSGPDLPPYFESASLQVNKVPRWVVDPEYYVQIPYSPAPVIPRRGRLGPAVATSGAW